MAIELISKIKPKNNGTFPLVDAVDVDIDGNGTRLSDVVNSVNTLTEGLEVGTPGAVTYRELSPTKYVKKSLYNVNNKTTYGNSANYHHAFFNAVPGVKYYVTGSTPSNTNGHPLCAFYDGEDTLLEKKGLTANTVYTNEEVTAPANAAYMVVNRSTSSVPEIVVKRALPQTGIAALDRLATSVLDIESAVTDIKNAIDEENRVLVGVIIDPASVNAGAYDINSGEPYSPENSKYVHAVYAIEQNSYYFVSGNSLTNTGSFPLCAFFDSNGNELSEFGTDPNTTYTDLLVKAPPTATTLIVNKSFTGVTILVKTGLATSKDEKIVASTRSYNLDTADALIRVHKQNPFKFKRFDKGYVTFIFDDLCDDVDSVASIFEQYGFPLVLAAIPNKMTTTASGLLTDRGNFTVGMTKKAIMEQVVANGGEIMTHNSAPVVTSTSQYDYDFMYEYFCTAKQNLNNAGFYPRGIIRAGGTGAINRSSEIDRWLIGNYEYANMGTLPQYNWDRTTIQKTQEQLKSAIFNAKTNCTWLPFMCHSYDFGNGDTFTGEADLIEILEYCRTIGIDVVTCGYIFDHYGSSTVDAALNSLSSGGTLTKTEITPDDYQAGYYYNVNKGTYESSSAAYAVYAVEPGKTYYVTGKAASNGNYYPACAFYSNASGFMLARYGTEASEVLTDYTVVAPGNAEYMVVNTSNATTNPITVKAVMELGGKVDQLDEALSATKVAVDSLSARLSHVEQSASAVKVNMTPNSRVSGFLFNALTRTEYPENDTPDARYEHCIYAVEPGKTYYVTGRSASNGKAYPICAFFNANRAYRLSAEGCGANQSETLMAVVAPDDAVVMAVNSTDATNVSVTAKAEVDTGAQLLALQAAIDALTARVEMLEPIDM